MFLRSCCAKFLLFSSLKIRSETTRASRTPLSRKHRNWRSPKQMKLPHSHHTLNLIGLLNRTRNNRAPRTAHFWIHLLSPKHRGYFLEAGWYTRVNHHQESGIGFCDCLMPELYSIRERTVETFNWITFSVGCSAQQQQRGNSDDATAMKW